MPFAFSRKEKDEEGTLRPIFPDGTSYLLLADGRAMEWGLYNYSLDEQHEDWVPEFPAGDQLAALISSGMRYPPALALAREEIAIMFRTVGSTLEGFESAMIESLRRHLGHQFDAGYMLVQSRVEELGYLHVPEWQWVMGLSKQDCNSVRWVSDDYFVYCNPISNFAFSEAQLRALRADRPTPAS